MKFKIILLIFVLFNLSYLETNAVDTNINLLDSYNEAMKKGYSENDDFKRISYAEYIGNYARENGIKSMKVEMGVVKSVEYEDKAGVNNNVDVGDIENKAEVNDRDIENTDEYLYANESGKKAILLEEKIKAQSDSISEIEKIQNGEGKYADMSVEDRQKAIDNEYDNIYKNGGDANGLIGKDNIREAKEELANQKQKLDSLKNASKEERATFEKEFDKDQADYEKRVAKSKERTDILVNNAKALGDLSKNKKDAEFKADVAKDDADYKERAATNREIMAKGLEKANNKAQQESKDIQKQLSEVEKELKEAKEGGASIQEIEELKAKAEDLSKKAKDVEAKAEDLSKKAEKARKDAEKARKDANEAKVKSEELSKKAEEAKKSLDDAKEINSKCVKDPNQCKKVYSPQQIKKAKEESAQKEIDKQIEKVNTECSKGDTIACREAITEMNKAETKKACIEPASQACKNAKDIKDISNDVANDYKKKAAEAAAQKEIDKGIDKVTSECSKGDTLACREAIAEMNKAEVQKACIEPASQACKDAKDIAKQTEAMVEQTKANIEANPGLKTLGTDETMNALLGITDNNVVESTSSSSEDGGFTSLSKLTVWFKDSLTSLVQILAVGAFLFVGIRLAIARGNPEEFKKALMHMIYVILGIFIISIAWAAVVLVAGINI